MKKWITSAAWCVLYVVCACLGLMGQPRGFGIVLYVLAALCFFVPGGLLLYWGIREGSRKTVLTVRILAILSLSLSLIALVANFLSILGTEALGNALYVVLVLVSVPMVCGQYWVMSLFLWACLLMASFIRKK